ncbi:MAG: hypothetical protein OHK0017_10770 [Patescibacteria group bacterium]
MEGLGIELYQILFYIICFVIAMLVLDQFLFRRVVKALNDREDSIKKALEEKEEIEDRLASVDLQVRNTINEAKEEARNIVREARESVEPEKNRVLDEARKESEVIVNQARDHAAEIVESARLKSQDEALQLVKKITAKALANMKVSSTEQEKVLSQIVNDKL